MDAIWAYGLTKKYGQVTALADFNLEIPQGDVWALVGSANCGKTTALRLLAGISIPSAGECTVHGFAPYAEAHKAHEVCGIVTDTARLYSTMTIRDNLMLFSKIYGIDQNDAMDRVSFLLHQLDIWSARDVAFDALPTSALQRANLARALLHRPKVLLMDEPTSGLDVETTSAVGSMIDCIVRDEGATVLMCTRHLSHAQQLCNAFGIMREGHLLAKGTLDVLSRIYGMKTKTSFRIAEGSPHPSGFVESDGVWLKSVASEEEVPALISQAVQEGCRLYEVKVIRPTLEDIYRNLFSDEIGVDYFDGEDISREYADKASAAETYATSVANAGNRTVEDEFWRDANHPAAGAEIAPTEGGAANKEEDESMVIR